MLFYEISIICKSHYILIMMNYISKYEKNRDWKNKSGENISQKYR
jgi:hypothetical protein